MVLVRLHSSIEEIHCEEGHKWKKAVSTYFDRLCSDIHESKVESTDVREEEAVMSVGTSESFENESGIEDVEGSKFFPPAFFASWNYMVWKLVLGVETS